MTRRIEPVHKMLAEKLLRDAMADGITRLAAALAFYAMLSLAPLLLLSLAFVQVVFGEAAARGELASAMQAFANDETAAALESLIVSAAESRLETPATLFSILVAIFGASGVFYQLKVAMNLIWDVPEDRKGRGWRHFLRMRIWGIGSAVVIIVFVVTTAFATSILTYVAHATPELLWLDAAMWRFIAFTFTTALYSILFSAIFRFMPDLVLEWRHVWKGGVLTAFVAALAQYGIGAYLARSIVSSVYGAAGALVVVLIWIYATSLILFAGAEVTAYLVHDDGAVARERAERQREQSHVARKTATRPDASSSLQA